MIYHEADERFVIFEEGVVFGLVFFDEGVFEQKSFALGGNNDRIDVRDFLDKEGDHGPRVASGDKILFDAHFKIFRFADIDDDVAAILH